MRPVGYQHLIDNLALPVFDLDCPSLLRPVTRLQINSDHQAVPATMAKTLDTPLRHVLFALKHEGTNLQVLAEALPRINAADLLAALSETPSGAYIRKACYLWEEFNGKRLKGRGALPTSPIVDLFDPTEYVTMRPRLYGPSFHRWRVRFNGLGAIDYCVTVRRTRAIVAGEEADVPRQAREFAESLSPEMLDRALDWAYLSETESSFEIERETPSPSKAQAFVALLQQAHQPIPLTEQYLVMLQQSAMTNPMLRESAFRTEQNWLARGGSRGALRVRYVPPPPELADHLMDALMRLSKRLQARVAPVTAASICKFAFVFIHPFMDGNGRLSRFVFHHTLCQAGALPRGLLLPVSVAMKADEAGYLKALESFSAKVRRHWQVTALDEDRYALEFVGSPAIYRYWDATDCVEFGHRVATQALEENLRAETLCLAAYDAIASATNERFDVRNKELAVIVRRALDQGGTVSKHSRMQFALTVQQEAFDFIEATAKAVLARRDAPAQPSPQPTVAAASPGGSGNTVQATPKRPAAAKRRPVAAAP